MLNFERQKAPLFTLHATSDDKYYGKITPVLIKKMDESHYNFRNTEYKCELEVIYTPESAVSKEKYDYTLIDIGDAQIDAQTEIIPEN